MFSKKEYQRRCLEEQEANGRVFQDFLETFQTEANTVKTKTWVKAGSFDAGTGREDDTDKGIIYEPKPFIKGHQDQQSTIRNAIECARIIKDKKTERISERRKHTTNLEALKEEIKQRHIERQKVKEVPTASSQSNQQVVQDILDPNSTNLYLGNINPKLTEYDLIQMFGSYGSLASVKIMWPRGDDNTNRNSHCGFVAYMSRKDAERAYDAMKTTDIKISWGKFVEVPQFPIYVPPALQSLTQPPPFSGLPFNAQPCPGSDSGPRSNSDQNLCNSTVKVSIPSDKKLLCVIHRMVEFVIREGPLFEAMIMNRELKNPMYKFLFENTSAAHTYYRWKLFSVMNGEAVKTWSTKPFRMFSGGSIWIPPTSLDFSKGMPEHLLEKTKHASMPKLSETQCKRFVHFLRDLSLKRLKIGETMVFCLNHSDCYVEIVEYICQSLCNPSTNPLKKLARLFLISDVLCNCTCKSAKNYSFRSEFRQVLPQIFVQMHKTLVGIKYSCDKEAFKTRVSKVLREWELWKIYSDDFLNKLETIFLGPEDSDTDTSDPAVFEENKSQTFSELNIPLPPTQTTDASLEQRLQQNMELNPGFVMSRWETVDPEEVEAQAMSTKKFYHMEMQRRNETENADTSKALLGRHEGLHSSKISSASDSPASKKRQDKKRKRLRELEVMVMQFQDELETGARKLKKDATLEKEVDRYRAKLMKEFEESDDSSNGGDYKEMGGYRSDERDDKYCEKKSFRAGTSSTCKSSCGISGKRTKGGEKRRRHKH